MVRFQDSQTKINLMRAFAGESQARNRYTFAAEQAEKQNLHVLREVFTFTANQEKEHGEIFYQLLQELDGQVIGIDGTYPVNTSNEISHMLQAACENEKEEAETVYPAFSKIAKEEGFQQAAYAFEMIAKIEKTHEQRFGHFLGLVKEHALFVSDTQVTWVCLNCGHVSYGTKAPEICPVCKHPQGFFIASSMAPFTE
ncbi:MAG: rubrerythrin [Massiliimalia sp.]|jgi:rubrerythrin